MVQSGALGRASVRSQIKENRKLSPAEVAQLVDAYQAGTSQAELSRRFDLHEQTVRAHLRRQRVSLRPLRALTEAQEVEVMRLYVVETNNENPDDDLVGIGSHYSSLVELRGIEPLTFSMRTRRATNCATAPRTCGSEPSSHFALIGAGPGYSPTARRCGGS